MVFYLIGFSTILMEKIAVVDVPKAAQQVG